MTNTERTDELGSLFESITGHTAVVAVRQEGLVMTTDVVAQRHQKVWRREALAREFRAIAAVPLVYDDIQYGVLAVYADESDALDDPLPSMLSKLGKSIAYVLNAIERKSRY